MREGDEVVVNVAALDLGLGSGGFDVVHVNLTRGLEGGGAGGEHVMKLNYTSLQHPVEPVERPVGGGRAAPAPGDPGPRPAAARPPGAGGLGRGAGGAGAEGRLRADRRRRAPGSLCRDVAELRERGLLCGHVTAAPAYGGEHEASRVAGALDAAAHRLGWDAVLAGPGPGIIGSETRLGHGGMAALDTAHAALALGMPTLLSPRLSAADPRERHRGVSHHTLTVLRAAPGPGRGRRSRRGRPIADRGPREACGGRHRLREAPVDLDGYAASGLPARTMGRGSTRTRSSSPPPLPRARPCAAEG